MLLLLSPPLRATMFSEVEHMFEGRGCLAEKKRVLKFFRIVHNGELVVVDYIWAFMYHILRVHPINLVYYCCDWPCNATGFVTISYPL